MARLLSVAANETCHNGYKCCNWDKRTTAKIRRSQRRRENQEWKRDN